MKKALITVLSLLFVFGITASAFAVHSEIPSETQAAVAKGVTQLTLGGELRFRGELKENVSDFSSDMADRSLAYDGRVRLSLQAETSKKTTGYVQLEAGNSDAADTYTWGQSAVNEANTATTSATGLYTEGNGKRGDLRILQAWIQSKDLFGTPLGLKIGHMPVKLGYGLFLDHSKFGDDTIMLFMNPTKEAHVALVTAKATEGNAASTCWASSTSAAAAQPCTGASAGQDDTTVYAALFTLKGAGFNFGGDVTYLDDQNYNGGNNDAGLHFANYGIRADSKIGPIGFKADMEFQKGKAKQRTATNTYETTFRGKAYLAGVNFDLSTIVLDLEMAVGSGDDDANDTNVDAFITSLGADQRYTYVYEYRARTAGVTAPSAGASGLAGTGTGIANTTYYKVGATAKPSKELTAAVSYYKLKATNSVAGTVGGSAMEMYGSQDIGSEVDGKIVYQLDKNLVYFVEGGYLFAGDFYRNITRGGGGIG
ncbi:MAG: alginate export family protein, partial [Nitrospirae bacterium]|nr:alginate export family protein [Nitrospirota bacterium]